RGGRRLRRPGETEVVVAEVRGGRQRFAALLLLVGAPLRRTHGAWLLGRLGVPGLLARRLGLRRFLGGRLAGGSRGGLRLFGDRRRGRPGLFRPGGGGPGVLAAGG